MQYDNIREAAKLSAWSWGKVDKYEYFTGEEILPADQIREIELGKFTYSPLEKSSEKQTKKQADALRSLTLSNKTNYIKPIKSIFPKGKLNDLIIDKLKEIMQLQNNSN